MGKLKLTVNEEKTRIRKVPEGEFDFPGYTFGRMYSARTGQARIGYRPSKKSSCLGRLPGRQDDHHAPYQRLRRRRRRPSWANSCDLSSASAPPGRNRPSTSVRMPISATPMTPSPRIRMKRGRLAPFDAVLRARRKRNAALPRPASSRARSAARRAARPRLGFRQFSLRGLNGARGEWNSSPWPGTSSGYSPSSRPDKAEVPRLGRQAPGNAISGPSTAFCTRPNAPTLL